MAETVDKDTPEECGFDQCVDAAHELVLFSISLDGNYLPACKGHISKLKKTSLNDVVTKPLGE